jgi:hypothetical protein
MSPSPAAAAVLESARAFDPSSSHIKRFERVVPELAVIGRSEATGAAVSGGAIHAQLTKGQRKVDVAYPVRANGLRTLALLSANATLSIALQGASETSAGYVDGYLVIASGVVEELLAANRARVIELESRGDVCGRWQKLDGAQLLPLVRAGMRFVDGVQRQLDTRKAAA